MLMVSVKYVPCPRIDIVPTSSEEAGQIYGPAANWLLMAGPSLIVVMFKISDSLGSAYGIAVSGTMLATTILQFFMVTRRWNWPLAAAVPVIAVFGTGDCAFLAANSLKIAEGDWFPLTIGGALAFLMWCWRRGSSELRHRLHGMSMPLADFIAHIDERVVGRAEGTAIWLTKVEQGVSPQLEIRAVAVRAAFLHDADRQPRAQFLSHPTGHAVGGRFPGRDLAVSRFRHQSLHRRPRFPPPPQAQHRNMREVLTRQPCLCFRPLQLPRSP
jgi:KUP system potassium uptake protein